MLALTTLENWHISSLNVPSTYLYIYDLKQAALQWNKQLHKSLLKKGFLRCKSDPETYFKIIGEDLIILLIYIDDALFMGSNKEQVLAHTVTPKSVTITNLKPGRTAPRNHPWECHFTLVGPNKVQALGYKLVPGSCDLAQGLQRYGNSKTGTPL